MVQNWVYFALILALIEIRLIECQRPLMCYIAGYAVYRPGPAKFMPDNVDPFMCTHIIYAHLGLSANSTAVEYRDPYADTSAGLGLLDKIADLKKKNPLLKVLFSLGGWNVGSVDFSTVAASANKRKAMAKNIITTIKRHNFDGIDMNWMYPNHRGGGPDDLNNYVLLLKEVRRELKKEKYLLVALLSGNEYIFKRAYDLQKIAEQLDYILLLCYDYHGFWDRKTGIFAPLNSTDPLNVVSAVNYYLKNGVERNKILLGFATHGRTFTADQNFFNDNYFEIPIKKGFSTAWTKEEGYMGYNEICHEFKNNNLWTKLWHYESSTPFAVSGKRLISYEDKDSFKAKLNYLKEENLGGAMLWSLDTDDFSGDCFGHKFPLASVIKKELQEYQPDYISEDYDDDNSSPRKSVIWTEEITDETSFDKRPLKILKVEVFNLVFK